MAQSKRQALRLGGRMAIEQAEAATSSEPFDEGRHEFRYVPVDEIRPDPEQARNLGLTAAMVRDPSSVSDEHQRERVEAIHGLAETIRQGGLRQPIVVYRDGSHYTVVDGERRYWAHVLLEAPTIEAKILWDPPERKRLDQFVANAQREDLTLAEQLDAVEQVIAESARQGIQYDSASELGKDLGYSRRQAYRWWNVVYGPEDLHEAIRSGVVSSVKTADDVAHEDDPERRRGILERLASGDSGAENKAAPKSSRSAVRGRPVKRITLGQTTDPGLVRHIVLAVDPDGPWQDGDFADLRSARKAWERFLKRISNRKRSE